MTKKKSKHVEVNKTKLMRKAKLMTKRREKKRFRKVRKVQILEGICVFIRNLRRWGMREKRNRKI